MNIITKVISSAIAFGKKSIFHTSLKGPFIAILCIYILMIVLPYFTSYVFLTIQAMSDKADVVDKSIDKMIKLFTLSASESTMLVAAFIGGLLQDSNNNGCSDIFEGSGKYSMSKTIEGKDEKDTVLDPLLEAKKGKDKEPKNEEVK